MSTQNQPTAILVRLPNWLGDTVMSFPFLNALRTLFPDASIDVITKKGLKALVSISPVIRHVYEFSKNENKGPMGLIQFGKQFKKQQYELFFTLPNSFSSALMGNFTGADERIGYNSESRGFLLTKAFNEPENLHRVETYMHLLEQYSGKTVKPSYPSLPKPAKKNTMLPEGTNLLLNINSEAQSRRIPIEVAASIVKQIRSQLDCNIVLTGSPAEKAYVDQLSEAIPDEKMVNLAGQTTLDELISVVASADYAVSSDSGIAHLANAYGVKTVVLFGAGDESQTQPFNPKNLKIVRKPGLECAPCVANQCKLPTLRCLLELNVSKITEALHSLDESA